MVLYLLINCLLDYLPTDSELSTLASLKRSKIANCTDLVELAVAAQTAANFVNASANTKLREIVAQMLALKDRAVEVLEEAKRDAELHQAACNMVKKPGGIYYFYEKSSASGGGMVASIISPQEWGESCPHSAYVGAFQLQTDHSWRPLDVERSERVNEVEAIVQKMREHPSLPNAILDVCGNKDPQ
ncbi:unnamed protein product [Mesocestoides corti]|uniref:Uncharacterized protein n=2 Tax=Mesocestoides corti TaxID=53468 RepID=A0A0R3U913_MESCO|nr:unnamed protein product [Mesocestoides corti]